MCCIPVRFSSTVAMQSFGQYYGRRIIVGTCSGIVFSSGVGFLGTFRNLVLLSTLSSVGLNKRAFLLLPIRFLLQGILEGARASTGLSLLCVDLGYKQWSNDRHICA